MVEILIHLPSIHPYKPSLYILVFCPLPRPSAKTHRKQSVKQPTSRPDTRRCRGDEGVGGRGGGGQRLAEISVAASTVSTAGGRAGGNTPAVSGARGGTCEFGQRRPGVAGRDTRLLSGRPSCLAHDKSIRGGRVRAHEPRVLFKKSSLR